MNAASRAHTSRLLPALVLAGWTLLVWTTRIHNIWNDDGLTTAGQLWRSALALVFTGLAVTVIAIWWRVRDRFGSVTETLIRVFAIWTIAVWIVRGVQIILDGHGAAFVVVHTVLAVVSIALAVWADRAVRRPMLPPRPATSVPVSETPHS